MKKPVSTVRWDTKEKARRMAVIAKKKGYSSINRLVNTLAEIIIAQEDAEASFRAAAGRGDKARALEILDRLDVEDKAAGIANTKP